MVLRLRIDGTRFRDQHNREVLLHGINASADAKLPSRPNQPSHEPRNFFDGDNVSFVGRPFELKDATTHFTRLRRWGYNAIRYIFTWEALEHEGPGKYDEEFISHSIEILRVAKRYGFQVFMDPHQDVWSRFTGGDGSPMWTLYACGLDPRKFQKTEAALVQNTCPDPSEFPKMVWATNYFKLACQVMFTLFYAGRKFAPLCRLDGVNIQDYLQQHFVNACRHFAKRMHEAGDIAGDVVIGWNTMNEPNRGLIGYANLMEIPKDQVLKLGTSPSAWQAILLGSGIACDVETWAFGKLGPYKSGTKTIDPEGETAWLSQHYDDSRYGWKRDPQWRLGECIWAQHSIWQPSSRTLLEPYYFSVDPDTSKEIDYEYFINTSFLEFFRRYRDGLRLEEPQTILLMEPSPNEIPPTIKGTADDEKNLVYAPHWNRFWNVDVIGVLRGKYLSPAFAIKVGETAIRNCFKSQLETIRKEGIEYMGEHPCLIGEIGVPYDMDKGRAYETGDYSNQTAALDANFYALEGAGVNFTIWNYCATNDHKHGDQWDGEDLSLFSTSDPESAASSLPNNSSAAPKVDADKSLDITREDQALLYEGSSAAEALPRAGSAFIRPNPIAVTGQLLKYGFDLKSCTFSLQLESDVKALTDAPTEIFLPLEHFPLSETTVQISDGKWSLDTDSTTNVQILQWWHGPGQQQIEVKGLVRKTKSYDSDEEESVWQQCRERICTIM